MKSEYICKTSITKSVEWHNTKKYIVLAFESTYYKLIVASNSMNEYILSLDVNEQLMIMVQKKQKVKERACQYLKQHLVNVTRPDK